MLSTLYQCEAVVSGQHDDVYGCGMVGHTNASTLCTILPESTIREHKDDIFGHYTAYCEVVSVLAYRLLGQRYRNVKCVSNCTASLIAVLQVWPVTMTMHSGISRCRHRFQGFLQNKVSCGVHNEINNEVPEHWIWTFA